jgi:hypothetical protein
MDFMAENESQTMTAEERAQAIGAAMYAQDFDALRELAPCGCCCDEHYFLGCPADIWRGCRGSYASDRQQREARENALTPG